jgi:hypothetical protein
MWCGGGQAGPAQPGNIEDGYVENPTLARGWGLKIMLDKAHYRMGSF